MAAWAHSDWVRMFFAFQGLMLYHMFMYTTSIALQQMIIIHLYLFADMLLEAIGYCSYSKMELSHGK